MLEILAHYLIRHAVLIYFYTNRMPTSCLKSTSLILHIHMRAGALLYPNICFGRGGREKHKCFEYFNWSQDSVSGILTTKQ